MSVVGIMGPLLAGSFIALMNAHYGFLAGNVLSYGVYGALALSVALSYLALRVPQDELLQARRDLAERLKKEQRRWLLGRIRTGILGLLMLAVGAGSILVGRSPRWALGEARRILAERRPESSRGGRIKGVTAARVDGRPTLLVEAAGNPFQATGIPSEFHGFPVKVVAPRNQWREVVEGFGLIWRNRFLRIYLLFSTFAVMMADPIIFSALPRYIEDVLPGVAAAKSAYFGLYLSAASLGVGLASLLMMMRKDRSADSGEPRKEGGLNALERQGRWSSILHGIGWLVYGGIFFSSSLWLSLGAMVLALFLQGPALAIWSSLLQKVLNRHFPESQGKIIASITFYQLLFAIVGSLLFGWLMTYLPTIAVLWIAGGVMVLMAALDILEPALVFPMEKSPDAN